MTSTLSATDAYGYAAARMVWGKAFGGTLPSPPTSVSTASMREITRTIGGWRTLEFVRATSAVLENHPLSKRGGSASAIKGT
ncbi:hypothetical protein AQI96_41525 [Streptomyces canus]|nr:hypothetical protein AQI96_41525 [Streptomyces canus]